MERQIRSVHSTGPAVVTEREGCDPRDIAPAVKAVIYSFKWIDSPHPQFEAYPKTGPAGVGKRVMYYATHKPYDLCTYSMHFAWLSAAASLFAGDADWLRAPSRPTLSLDYRTLSPVPIVILFENHLWLLREPFCSRSYSVDSR